MGWALERLERIASAHSKSVDEHGGTWGSCTECSWNWPCPTYHWATARDVDIVLDPWNPSDKDSEGF